MFGQREFTRTTNCPEIIGRNGSYSRKSIIPCWTYWGCSSPSGTIPVYCFGKGSEISIAVVLDIGTNCPDRVRRSCRGFAVIPCTAEDDTPLCPIPMEGLPIAERP